MADYKRMVSYMYQYENGVKRKNVGYARIESKSGQCKITLHMQLLGQLDSIFPTYLIHRDHEGMELIYLGDTLLKSQVMDSKLTADDTNIMDSGLTLADMGGLLLFLNDKVFFASDWDDIPIVAEEVLEALRPKPKKPAVAEEPEDTKSKLHVADTPFGVDAPMIAEVPVGDLSDLSPADQMKLPKYKLPRGWKTVERLQKTYADLKYSKEDKILEAADITTEFYCEPTELQRDEIFMESQDIFASDETPSENEMSYSENGELLNDRYEDSAAEAENGTSDNNGSSDAEAEDEPIDQTGSSDTEVEDESIDQTESPDTEAEDEPNDHTGSSDTEELQDNKEMIMPDASMTATQVSNSIEKQEEQDNPLSHPEETEMPDHPTAKHLFDHHPRIYPFEDNDILLCVKIEPKDIGLLPKTVWTYSNNSFLMHGYYCYHHLIFAKMKDQYGCHYILGIPGIYHNREQFMARMFGFENFKSIKKRDLKQGDFGYWYLPINF